MVSSMSVLGLTVVVNFITNEEEAFLIRGVNENWGGPQPLKRRTQHYGYVYDYASRQAPLRAADLPAWQTAVQERICAATDRPPFEQMIVNEYTPGQGIAAHIDSIDAFGDTICSLSMGSAVMIVFARGSAANVELYLQPRTLVIMQGESRYKWTHHIPARKSDTVNGERKLRTTRLSLTYRCMRENAHAQ